MKAQVISGVLRRLALLLVVLSGFAGLTAPAKDCKFEAVLIWATNAEKSPDPKHKPVDADVLKKLKDLPLKWKNFFAVTNVSFSLPPGGAAKVKMSDECKIGVRDIDGDKAEIAQFGKGKATLKGTYSLPVGETLILGGNAPDSTGWLVALRRIE